MLSLGDEVKFVLLADFRLVVWSLASSDHKSLNLLVHFSPPICEMEKTFETFNATVSWLLVAGPCQAKVTQIR
jgi:hypothetical protein